MRNVYAVASPGTLIGRQDQRCWEGQDDGPSTSSHEGGFLHGERGLPYLSLLLFFPLFFFLFCGSSPRLFSSRRRLRSVQLSKPSERQPPQSGSSGRWKFSLLQEEARLAGTRSVRTRGRSRLGVEVPSRRILPSWAPERF